MAHFNVFNIHYNAPFNFQSDYGPDWKLFRAKYLYEINRPRTRNYEKSSMKQNLKNYSQNMMSIKKKKLCQIGSSIIFTPMDLYLFIFIPFNILQILWVQV